MNLTIEDSAYENRKVVAIILSAIPESDTFTIRFPFINWENMAKSTIAPFAKTNSAYLQTEIKLNIYFQEYNKNLCLKICHVLLPHSVIYPRKTIWALQEYIALIN